MDQFREESPSNIRFHIGQPQAQILTARCVAGSRSSSDSGATSSHHARSIRGHKADEHPPQNRIFRTRLSSGRTDTRMSKRRGQEHEHQHRYHRDGAGKRSRREKHLYLVLDDWKKGFTIHKIDADSFDSDSDSGFDDDDTVAAAGHHLPGHLAVRLESPGPDVGMSFTFMGSKIFIVTDQRYGQTPSLIYDTETAGLAFGPRVPAELQCGFNTVIAAGGTLYAFSPPHFNKQNSYQVMSWQPSALDDITQYPSEEGWSWKSLPAPPPPFDRYEIITSYVVHPDRRTIFMTTSGWDSPGLQKSTYSFDTKHCVWRWYAWVLPFQGQGYYDSELDAWVGLHKDGYICSCRVAYDSGSATPIKLGLIELDWQTVEEKMFRKDRDRHLRASLTYMGRSKFCIVETVMREEADMDYYENECVLHMTMFGLKYNHRGELRTTNHRSTRSYLVPKYKDFTAPVAFWM